MQLSRFPRVTLCHQPTPLEALPNLSKALGGPNLYIKRDDCTGLATGGNKTRKLEYLMGDALDRGADVVLTEGALQSNHARQTAAAAAKLGLDCHLVLEHRVEGRGEDYEHSGNVLLDNLLGANIHHQPAGSDMDAAVEEVADGLRATGAKPYVIPNGGSGRVGALGYARAAFELIYQADQMDLRIDHIVQATGSGGTQSGMLAGLAGLNARIPVHGITVRRTGPDQEELVDGLANETAEFIGVKGGVPREAVMADGGYVGPGYGQPTPEMIEAVGLLARLEGVLLDPVYTGKGMAGLIGMIRDGRFKNSDNVVFLHTGGTAALFAYRELFGPERHGEPSDGA